MLLLEDEQQRQMLTTMLRERGVDSVDDLMSGLDQSDVDGVLGAIAMWDDMPHDGPRAVSPGLLVKKIREGGVPGYRRAHERTSVDEAFGGSSGLLDADLRRHVVGQISGAAMDREEARDHLARLAARLMTPVDALIDSLMGQHWTECPPHPALPTAWRGRNRYPEDQWELAGLRYAWLVGNPQSGRPPAEPSSRKKGESDWNFACRYWGYTDPPELLEAHAKALARAEAEAKQRAEDERRRTELAAKTMPAAVAVIDATASEDDGFVEPW